MKNVLPIRIWTCFNNPTMSILDLTPTQLRQAADLKEKITGLENELATLLGTETKAAAATVPEAVKPTKKGGMSAAGKAAIRAAQKARWAKVNAGKTPKAEKAEVPAVVEKPAKKRKMSAEGRAAIIAAQKKRWAEKKAAKA